MTFAATRARYDALARAYIRHWAPVLAVLARPLIAKVGIERGRTVLDIGCGPGAISSLCARRSGIPVIGVDASIEMLLAARRRPVRRAAADARRLPIKAASIDIAVSTFMLQHVPQPGRVFAEASRALRPGGSLATATWHDADDETGGPYDVAEEVLDGAGAQPDTVGALRTYHHLVARPEQMQRYARAAGFASNQAWLETASWGWTPASFTAWAEACGPFSRRLATLPETRRRRALDAIARGVAALPPDQMIWRPRIVYCIARR